jgi:tetratricopeptide (TPR) repeat protein
MITFGTPKLASALLLLLCLSFTTGLPGQTADLARNKSFAESQHEIVKILISKKEFAKAAAEANKIFQMKWPDDQEPILLKELLGFSDQFLLYKQNELALQLLDTNLPLFKSSKSKASIWKEKGYLLEKMGQHDKALECFREAQRVEKIDDSLQPAERS